MYYVTKSTTINNTNESSAFGNNSAIDYGGTVVIYIPAGVTLTVKGADAYGPSPGGAGIRAEGGTLIITGGGTLNATGGAGYNDNYLNNEDGYWKATSGTGGSRNVAGTGGHGGKGGGGAGAGIGGAGGVGSGDASTAGSNGSPGQDGNPGEACTSNIYVLGGTTVNAYGGGYRGYSGFAPGLGGTSAQCTGPNQFA